MLYSLQANFESDFFCQFFILNSDATILLSVDRNKEIKQKYLWIIASGRIRSSYK